MANIRPVLLITLLFLGYLIWVEWQKDYAPQPQAIGKSGSPVIQDMPAAGDLPDEPVMEAAAGQTPAPAMRGEAPVITVTTDVLEVGIDPVGGTVVSARLLDYPVSLDIPANKVSLFSQNAEDLFIAQSGLLSRQAAPNHTSNYSSTQTEYRLADGAVELRVPLTWSDPAGISTGSCAPTSARANLANSAGYSGRSRPISRMCER